MFSPSIILFISKPVVPSPTTAPKEFATTDSPRFRDPVLAVVLTESNPTHLSSSVFSLSVLLLFMIKPRLVSTLLPPRS